jgi:YkoY family integral membrane protein
MWIFQPADLPLVGGYVLVLVFFEGLLSADNALVLALMVRHLPRIDQRRVLRYGIWGAIGFRVIAVLLATQLRKYWIFKVIGGLYLLYLAISHFVSQRRSATAEGADRSAKPQGWWQGFWGTVTSITLADIAFSIDSILAAVTMAEDFPARFGDSGKTFILLTGGILGIITMRFAVRLFVSLLERFSGLAEGAYYLVAWIGLKLLISGFHTGDYLPFKIEEWLFWSGSSACWRSQGGKNRKKRTLGKLSISLNRTTSTAPQTAGRATTKAPRTDGRATTRSIRTEAPAGALERSLPAGGGSCAAFHSLVLSASGTGDR